jgi:hypothetical protein
MVTVATLVDAPLVRLTLGPSPDNGLRKTSQIMVDKTMTVMRDELGLPFGKLDEDAMIGVNSSVGLFLGLRSRTAVGPPGSSRANMSASGRHAAVSQFNFQRRT